MFFRPPLHFTINFLEAVLLHQTRTNDKHTITNLCIVK